ncbi:unnamed protein product [Clonostachys chloroleuca]|uniref:Aminotransferase class I/classII large domain-containing protein n=1 Tax=Clonostachys chloroleuca TaxID=1926264 RepID=A0AA35QEV1_9HYPO|nr:unnamed protein product [Clonostachys chloroleuca]
MASLSNRTGVLLQQLGPSLLVAKQPSLTDTDSIIDISGGENELLQQELHQVLQLAISEATADELFSLPVTFGGNQDARENLTKFFNGYFDPARKVLPDQIVLTAGAGNGIEILMQSICDEGDSVIVPAPLWWRPKVNIITATPPNYARHAQDLVLAIEAAFEAAQEPSRVKALILTNPQNPLSRCYPKDVILECVKFCNKKGLHFISDEIYALATFGSAINGQPRFHSALSIQSEPEDGLSFDPSKIHVVWSPSKLFGLGGLRIGCIVSQDNPPLRAATSLLAYAGISALSTSMLNTLLASPALPELLEKNSSRLTASYQIFADGLARLGVDFIPASEGLFVFARIGKDLQSQEEELALKANLEQHEGVRVSPGWLYNQSTREFGWARLTISIPQERAEEVMVRLSNFLTKN